MFTIADRAAGMILGGAIGDGWGSRFEGQSRPENVAIPERIFVSDDTQLTLATCESLIERRRVDPGHIAGRFAVWYRQRRVSGAGSSTLKALQELEAGGHWALSGARGERAAGNGAAMRVAPLAFFLDPVAMADRRVLRDVCRITHQHDEAYVGALAVVMSIHQIAHGAWHPAEVLERLPECLPDSRVRDRILELLRSGIAEDPVAVAERFGCSGFVVDTVPLAVAAARAALAVPFEELMVRVVMAGGDTDTTASITGQIAGAAIGVSAVPRDLFQRIDGFAEIESVAGEFGRTVCSGTSWGTSPGAGPP